MAKCTKCRKNLDALPFVCSYCRKNHCSKHRLPEEHNCKPFAKRQKRARKRTQKLMAGVGRKPKRKHAEPKFNMGASNLLAEASGEDWYDEEKHERSSQWNKVVWTLIIVLLVLWFLVHKEIIVVNLP